MLHAMWTRRRMTGWVLLASLLLIATLGGWAHAEHQRRTAVVELIRDRFQLQPDRRDFDQGVALIRPDTCGLASRAHQQPIDPALVDFLARNQPGTEPAEPLWLAGELPLAVPANRYQAQLIHQSSLFRTRPVQAVFLSAVGLSPDHREAWVCLRGYSTRHAWTRFEKVRRVDGGWQFVEGDWAH